MLYAVFVIFALMWLAMVGGLISLWNLLDSRDKAEQKGESTWTLGL